MAASPSLLNLPNVPVEEFERNFLKTVVCELRFPTLLEFETTQPVQLQKALRKDYPYYEPGHSLSLGPGAVDREASYLFRSRKKDWTVSFKASALLLETTRYRNFEAFLERFARLVDRSRVLLDTDFFTRVGLRYIDEIPLEDGTPSGWIREELIAPLTQGTYGTVERIFQEVKGFIEGGRYTFRHGMPDAGNAEQKSYRLDFDFYEENVPFDSMLDLVSQFNQQSFQFFHWALGPKALERLAKQPPRRREDDGHAHVIRTSLC